MLGIGVANLACSAKALIYSLFLKSALSKYLFNTGILLPLLNNTSPEFSDKYLTNFHAKSLFWDFSLTKAVWTPKKVGTCFPNNVGIGATPKFTPPSLNADTSQGPEI